MKINLKSNRNWKWSFLLSYIAFVCNTLGANITNQVILHTKEGSQLHNYTRNVSSCISLQGDEVLGKLTSISIEHNESCVEVHQESNCKYDYLTAKLGSPANNLSLWLSFANATRKIHWMIHPGAKAVGPCRDKCDDRSIELPEPDKTFNVTLYGGLYYDGLAENVSIKGCQVIPKPLRNNVLSFKYNELFCIEFHETRDCSRDFIQIPKETPYQLTQNLYDWKFENSAVAVSRCGYNCPNSRLKTERKELKVKRWTGPENKMSVTLYSEPDFEGKNQTFTFNPAEVDCFNINISDNWRLEGTKTESIQTYDFCIDVFEKDTECARVEGEYLRLNYSKEARDIIASGWTGVIKSITACLSPTNGTTVKDDTVKVSYFLIYLIAGLYIAFLLVTIIFLLVFVKRSRKRKQTKVLARSEINEFRSGYHYAARRGIDIGTEGNDEALEVSTFLH